MMMTGCATAPPDDRSATSEPSLDMNDGQSELFDRRRWKRSCEVLDIPGSPWRCWPCWCGWWSCPVIGARKSARLPIFTGDAAPDDSLYSYTTLSTAVR